MALHSTIEMSSRPPLQTPTTTQGRVTDTNRTVSAVTPATGIAQTSRPGPQSVEDKKLSAALSIRKNVARLSDAMKELKKIVVVLKDKDTDERVKQQDLSSLENVFIPFMETAIEIDLPEAIKGIDSIAGTAYLHKTNEAKENQAARQLNGPRYKRKSIEYRRVVNSLSDQKQRPAKRARIVRQLPVQPAQSNAQQQERQPVRLPRRPPPLANSTYSANECVAHLCDVTNKERAALLAAWRNAGWLPVHISAVYNRLKDHKEGREVLPFHTRGRRFLLPNSRLDETAQKFNAQHGKSLGNKQVKEIMKDEKRMQSLRRGLVPLQVRSPCRTTVTTTKARLANHTGLSITTQTIAKTVSRQTAENSLVSAMALIVAVAATHYQITTTPQPTMLSQLEQASPGAKKLYELLQSSHGPGIHLRCVHPSYILSTDDTVSFVFEGKEQEKEQFSLVGVNSNRGRHTRSHYEVDATKSHCGLRVKLTYTFSGAGVQAPPFITIAGLTPEELPTDTCPSGILSLEVEGLTVAGAGVSVGSMGKGYVSFIRNDSEQASGKRMTYYRNAVLFPFITNLRREYSDWQEGTPLSQDVAAVSWCDGDHDQIASILTAIDEYEDHLVDAVKQNAARTGTEQAADLCRIFPNMNNLHRRTTVVDTPTDLNPLKRGLATEFDKLTRAKQLNLPSSKRNALIDFITCVPQTMARACTTSGILHGFKENGMLDSQTKRFPDFDKLLATCRTEPTEEEYERCLQTFPTLLRAFLDQGHIPDATFLELGFSPDVDAEGNEVHRESVGANNETKQRCKVLTHGHQVRLRNEKLSAIEAEAARVEADKRKKIQDTLDLNAECERKLQSNGEEVTLTHLSSCTIALLKAYILARSPGTKLSGVKKGTIDKANEGENNLLKIAFEVRDKRVALELPQVNTQDDSSDDDDVPLHHPPTTRTIYMTNTQFKCTESASDVLESREWRETVKATLICEGQVYCTIDETKKQQADLLQTLLLQRLASHVNRRVPNPSVRQRTSWVFEYAAGNMARMSAIMVLQGHVKPDLACLGAERTLLVQHANSFMLANSQVMARREGAYLYFDFNDGVHIRSGKVTGRPFTKRHEEHLAMASEGTGSVFYRRYPSRELTSGISAARKGCFENLHQLVAVGYDAEQEDVDESLAVIFMTTPEQRERIGRLRFGSAGGSLPMDRKMRHMVSYVTELAYDLAICVSDNTSTSPGFESCGLFRQE